MRMGKATLTSGQLWRSVHMEKSYLGKAWCKAGNPPLEVAPEQRKTHVNSYRGQAINRGKVDPRVSELHRWNEFSRDHVNRHLERVPPTMRLREERLIIELGQKNFRGPAGRSKLIEQTLLLNEVEYTCFKKL